MPPQSPSDALYDMMHGEVGDSNRRTARRRAVALRWKLPDESADKLSAWEYRQELRKIFREQSSSARMGQQPGQAARRSRDREWPAGAAPGAASR